VGAGLAGGSAVSAGISVRTRARDAEPAADPLDEMRRQMDEMRSQLDKLSKGG
ncbi:MAG: hypothetical protein RLZZ542_577, partial [Pseudomonadota bacterium]